MPEQCREGDFSLTWTEVEKILPACFGPAIKGSPTMMVDGKPALRVPDEGVHFLCTSSNQWRAVEGSATVLIDGMPAVRKGDQTLHCGGLGKMITGSSNCLIGGPSINILDQARENALEMLALMKEALERWNEEDQALFEQWFGTVDEEFRQEMLDRVNNTIEAVENSSNEMFRLPAPDMDKTGLNAYVYGSRTANKEIYLGDNWFDGLSEDSTGGRNSRPATLIHEFSHFDDIGDTKDHAYDDNTIDLGATDPEKAQENADSFENWGEDIYGQEYP